MQWSLCCWLVIACLDLQRGLDRVLVAAEAFGTLSLAIAHNPAVAQHFDADALVAGAGIESDRAVLRHAGVPADAGAIGDKQDAANPIATAGHLPCRLDERGVSHFSLGNFLILVCSAEATVCIASCLRRSAAEMPASSSGV